jgi:hypothetical protein
MHPFESYLRDLSAIHASGAAVAETSYYGPLETLLNEIGKTLKPRVRCIIALSNRGAGLPDGGLFTPDQFQKADGGASQRGQLPSRGAIEVKSTADDVTKIAAGEQVRKYLARYGQVLVTNYRDFLLLGRGPDGQPVTLERYQLASGEPAFWSQAANARAFAEQHAERFAEYLKRVMLANAPLTRPQDVAFFLASYARDARVRVERAALPALGSVRAALEQGLGITFSGERGDHFFRSTLVQTLFYGVFSAWVLWHSENPERTDSFDWRVAGYYLHVPVIQALFEQVASASRLRSLGLLEVLGWTGAALNRVERAAFFGSFEAGLAVQYFYEPFLEAFDPELRKQLGVWYTPPEIVQYQVARVDTVLREELGIADGLADPQVYVLDPCCGTGAYLVAVLERIARTLADNGAGALLGEDLRRAATERVFGFEILPAPFVVAHLQLGLLLQGLDAALAGEHERVGVYLTNALTGWAPPDAAKQGVQLALEGWPELRDERDSAAQVKRARPILVILGNPPYSGFAGISRMEEERDLSVAYRTTKQAPAPQGQGLNDLYVRFFRMAERRIAQTGRGVVCFISNYSWLDGLSFTGMRERYLELFDQIWIDNLNGDKYKTGKLTPEGLPDPSVFSTPFNPEGIQVGTAIALLVKKAAGSAASIRFRHLWGKTKRADLIASLAADLDAGYLTTSPPVALGFPFMPTQVAAEYLSWPTLPELFPVSFPGVKTSRDDVVVDIDRERLIRRMEQYFDPAISHAQMRQIAPGAMESTARFQAEAVRDQLRKRGLLRDNFIRYCYRPFDIRWLYWEPETKFLDEKRSEYKPHVFAGNVWIEARQRQPMEHFDRGYVVKVLSDNFGNGLSSYFPLYLRGEATLFDQGGAGAPRPNLSERAAGYGRQLGVEAPELFFHTIAVLHAPRYRAENAGALRQDWPRVPLPASQAALLESAALGRQLAALLDSEQAVAGVTAGPARPELSRIALITRVGGGSLNLTAGEADLTANWGYAGRGGITMPATGKAVERAYSAAERDSIAAGAAALGLAAEEVLALLGPSTFDVYLNELACWQNIPAQVWEYSIGGYQVIKKWLSYRERELLGRGLSAAELREVMGMARRIAAILLLGPALDASYAVAVRLFAGALAPAPRWG